MKNLLLIGILLLFSTLTFAQVAISDAGTAIPDERAVLDLQSTDKGLLLPVLTLLERINMPAPIPAGLMVRDDISGRIYYYNGLEGWTYLTSDNDLFIGSLNDANSNTSKTSYYIGQGSGTAFNNAASDNTALGVNSGVGYGNGIKNTAIGSNAGPAGAGLTHTTALGYNAKATANHQVVLGTISETVIIPNKVNVVPQNYASTSGPQIGASTGDLYVESTGSSTYEKGLYYYNGTSWELLSKPKYAIGDIAFGGVIGYIDETGEHGFVVSQVDVADAVAWAPVSGGGNPANSNTTMAGGDGLWAGEMNTAIITGTSNFINNGSFAAHDCSIYTSQIGSGPLYGDWYLPSTWELQRMYDNRVTLGLGSTKTYWSSTDDGLNNVGDAFSLDFSAANVQTATQTQVKTTINSIRGVRKF